MPRSTRNLFLAISVIVAATIYSGCNIQGQGLSSKADAVAVLAPTKGNAISGAVTFSRTKDGLRVLADITNLTPGAHGFHLHAFGDCRAEDGSSAGGHFNPFDNQHGAPGDEDRHMGDLGNLIADESGAAKLDLLVPLLTLEGENSIIGRSVVVHAMEDDYKTQPHGAAGARLACGVIGMARQ